MIILDADDRSLQMELGGAVNANELDFVASYVDVQAPDLYEPATQHGQSNGGTAVDLVSAPTGTRRRQVKYVSIHQADDMPVALRIFYDDNGTERTVLSIAALPTLSHVTYSDGVGWRVLSPTGELLVTTA